MGVTGGEPLGFNVGAQGPGGTLPGLDLVRLDSYKLLPVSQQTVPQAQPIIDSQQLSQITRNVPFLMIADVPCQSCGACLSCCLSEEQCLALSCQTDGNVKWQQRALL